MEWLNYHHLYYFWTVARLKSFTKAAEELRIAQSAVSHQVAQLEHFFGKQLILRSTSKKLELTEEGLLVLSQAEEIFRQGSELVEGIKHTGLQSTIRFGALGSLSKNLQIQLLRPMIDRDGFELNIDVGDATTLLTRLRSFNLDAILCDVPYSHSEDDPLVQREIAKEPYCFVGKSARKDTGAKKKLSLDERLSKDGLYLPAKSNPATSEILSFLKTRRIKCQIKGYIDDIALLRLLALETDSVVAIPRIGAERELKSKELAQLFKFPALYQRFYIVLRQKGPRTPKLLALLRQQ